jgi:hypothetical protein
MNDEIILLIDECSEINEISSSLQHLYSVIITHQMTKGSVENKKIFTSKESNKFLKEIDFIDFTLNECIEKIRCHIRRWGCK